MHDPALSQAGPAAVVSSPRYQWTLILLLSFNFGVVFLDRNAFSFLATFIQPDLGLTNTQVGLAVSALSFSWALAGLFMGRLSDKLGRRKLLLLVSTVVFSAASVLSGLAATFAMLLGARLLMGIAEGGIMPISQTLIATEVAPQRRGLAMGITQNFGANVIANSLGPIVIVAIAVAYGWRNAFFLAAIPGFVIALLIALLLRDPPPLPDAARRSGSGADIRTLLGDRTILICILMSVLLVAYLVVFSVFTPLYLVNLRGFEKESMSYVMASFGFASIAVAFLVPGSSDVFGRRPVAIIASLLGLALPFGLLFTSGTAIMPIILCIAVGAAISGVFPMVMATVPSEIAPRALTATALSLTMGISEIVGGDYAPPIAGRLADGWGLSAPIWLLVGLALATGLLAFGLRETAPRVLARRQGTAAAA